jgi:hypothetical protein
VGLAWVVGLIVWLAGGTGWSFPADRAIEAILPAAQAVLSQTQVSWVDAAGHPVTGFRPGTPYPPLYARDTAWIVPAARTLYPPAAWQPGIEAFLRRQYTAGTTSDDDGWPAGAGALPGVLYADGRIDKASATSDEETSLIEAASYVVDTAGPGWLTTTLSSPAAAPGPRVIDQLDAALDWLWHTRYDPTSGLIWRGHTTDWGDVALDTTAPDRTDIDPARAIRTASIYDQVLAWRAAHHLAGWWETLGNVTAAQHWRARAAALRAAANHALWQPHRGFYRLHVHLPGPGGAEPWQHNFDEGRILAIGNAVAVWAGFTSPAQARSILDRLGEAQLAAGQRQPGLSLWHPYGSWTYPYPEMQWGQYQNGGLWDWWAGVQVLAEFETGDAARGLLHLRQLAHAWAAPGERATEWRNLAGGTPTGASDYAPAAATVMQAVVQGLYGVSWQPAGHLQLTVRLGEYPGTITAALPGTDRQVWYDYQPAPEALHLDYRTHGVGSFPLWLRLPPGREAAAVNLDNSQRTFTIEQVGRDRFVALEGLPGQHRVVVRTVPSLPWWQQLWQRWYFLRQPAAG